MRIIENDVFNIKRSKFAFTKLKYKIVKEKEFESFLDKEGDERLRVRMKMEN